MSKAGFVESWTQAQLEKLGFDVERAKAEYARLRDHALSQLPPDAADELKARVLAPLEAKAWTLVEGAFSGTQIAMVIEDAKADFYRLIHTGRGPVANEPIGLVS